MSAPQQDGPGRRSPFIPLLILFLATAAWSGFQFRQLQLEKATLTTLRTNQEELVQQAEKVRSTLDRLALETQKLADAGNPSARIVVDELRRRGVTINPPAPQDAARK